MNTKILLLPLVLAAAIMGAFFGACSDDTPSNDSILPEKELEELDKAMAKAEMYHARACRPLDSLLKIAADTARPVAERSGILSKVAHAYSVMDADTAFKIANDAIRLASLAGNDSLMLAARIARVSALTSGGLFNNAEKEFIEIEAGDLPPKQKEILWQVGRQMYAYMALYAEGNFEISEKLRRRAMQYDDSLLSILPDSLMFRNFIVAERLVSDGNYEHARLTLDSLMKDHRNDSRISSMAAYQLALVSKNTGKERDYVAYMATAATGDIHNGVREGLALFNLANWLYHQGEVTTAFRYINFAMREAMNGKARMRAVNIASMLPMIDEQYRISNKKSHDHLTFLSVILCFLLFALGVFVTILVWQRRRREAAQKKLTELSHAQENHIANFLALCSTYYHKLNSLEQLVQRKISSGQTDELLKLLKNGRHNEEGEDEIFEIFDRSFMELYPDFIEQINLLLRPEERFDPHPGKKGMHIEVRIYALVKLGITESPRIAQILNYSVRTVYTYRNKMRNKAIDRENFEDNIRAI